MAEVKRYVTPVFRVSFPNLFEAKAMTGPDGKPGQPKFGLSAVWDPSKFTEKEKELWKILGAALNGAAQEKFKCNFKDLPANVKRGLRDGNEKADLEGYGAGTRFANITSKMRPGVVNLAKEPIGPEHGNADEIYPGCYARATVTVYTYDKIGKGIAIGLMNVQKVKDGGRLDSRTDAAEDFEDAVDSAFLDQDEANLSDDDFLNS